MLRRAAAAPAAVSTSSAGSKRKSTAEATDAAARSSSSAAASAPLFAGSEENPSAASASVASAPSAASVSSTSAGSAPAASAGSSSALSASSSSAPNPFLASVLESLAAAAPVAKRTRRAAQSAQATAAQARSSPMIRLLGADSGARQSLLEMMDLSDIARLQCTGRAWRGWIADAPFIGPRAVVIEVKRDQANNPSRCPWIRRSVQQLEYEDLDDDYSGDSSDDGEAHVSFDQLMLLQWSRLRSIKATFHRPLASAELLRVSFVSVAATLQQLDVSLYEEEEEEDPSTAANLLTASSPLHQLQSLTIDTMCDLPGLDLSALPALPRLQRLTLCGIGQGPCTPAQVGALAQCKSLTDLECGRWLPMLDDPRQSVVLNADQLQRIEDGLGRLWRLRKDNGAAPLRRLYLGSRAMVLPPCWRVLSQFTTLEELDAHWSCTLTAADWMLLANFRRLRSLTIRYLEREDIGGVGCALLDLGLVLPVLVHCRAFRTLELFGRFDLRTEHAALLAQVPSLESFSGSFLRIESLEPLSNAPALTELNLWCVGLNGGPTNIRAMIPPMPLVRKLTITDHWLSRLTAEQAEPFNTALLARLPKLTPDRFTEK